MFTPLISICIPAYKQPALLQRCLDSIAVQTYKNIEIIISDDSDDNNIAEVIKQYADKLRINYQHNTKSLGSPANWNSALNKATGELYLLLHHDDYLAKDNTLECFRNYFETYPTVDGVFSKTTPVGNDKIPMPIRYEPRIIKKLLQEPDQLIRSNQIGPPSNLMLRTSVQERYDTRLVWLVDVEFYIRLIKKGYKLGYIDETLVCIGIHPEQITQFCMNNPHIILKENLALAQQVEKKMWNNIQFYDYFWRLFRNNHIEKETDLWSLGINEVQLVPKLKKMLSNLSKLPASLRFNGAISKTGMFLSWIQSIS